MGAQQKILRVRRDYNRWVGNQTLEDYALRFTPRKARRWSTFRVANAAIGGISFLALEAIGGAITLTYGFTNAMAAILVVGAIIFATGLPISYYSARHGVDIDLLTRGAGFGYLGSTITSLIYASFTFIFFALEGVIMAKALRLSTGLPEVYGYLLCSLVVIPLVTHGFTFISRFQLWTQPLWIVLQILPFVCIAIADHGATEKWAHFTGLLGPVDGSFDLLLFGAASGVVFSLVAQIGEQVDYLRFLPRERRGRRLGWWVALISTGPGWIVLGMLKLVAGSFLAYLAFRAGVPPGDASEPTQMYFVGFGFVISDSKIALGLAALFVVVSQLKINVTNSYAGSIAWSNFFSRLTHSHPGRVVWLVFNIAISLLLMEFGIYKSLQHILGLYSHVAVAWVGALFADLVVNKPLGLSPRGIEFKRAHLYDINPVGFGGMLIASCVSICAWLGLMGEAAAALSCFVSLGVALVATPAIACLTGGRFYSAREPASDWGGRAEIRCCICEHDFEREDMSQCPAYAGPICSLCCTLDARCHDQCKDKARLSDQLIACFAAFTPAAVLNKLNSSLGHYLALLTLVAAIIGGVLALVYWQTLLEPGPPGGAIRGAMLKAFVALSMIAGLVCWLFVLSHESRVVAQEETARQTTLLMQEIEAHEKTDRALQKAKEVAEAANLAKSRYLAGISHEFRTPLNAILGYAQLLDKDGSPEPKGANAIRTIRRSGEHLASLVDGLLDIATIEAGRLELQRNIVKTDEFLDQIVDMFRLQAESRGIGFFFERKDRLPRHVRTDEKRLRQILINLLSNAIKFTNAGEVSLIVRMRGEVVEFVVEDTGVGIEPGDLERIFRPFERIESKGAWIPGTGLGLTITKLMTEVMGGQISVVSRPGAGSTFTVRLYLSAVVEPAGLGETSSAIRGYLGPRVSLVVADDDESHRRLIGDMLSPLGISVFPASDGPECLRLVERIGPRLVLLDINMPGMSGWDVAREIRERLASSCAIIMVSADMPELSLEDARFACHDDYVGKPFDLDALLEKIGITGGITWTREIRLAEQPLAGARRFDAAQLPPLSELRDLKSLGQLGFPRAIGERLADIARSGSGSPLFVNHLAELVAGIDMDAYLATIEMALDEHNATTVT